MLIEALEKVSEVEGKPNYYYNGYATAVQEIEFAEEASSHLAKNPKPSAVPELPSH